MFYQAKDGTLPIQGTTMDYIRFGTGSKVLVLLPGLGDGLRTIKGTALPMALMYRAFAGEYTVYSFSRLTRLQEGCTTRDMARNLKLALDALGIQRVDLVGVSMGGMIAQHFAADYPEKLSKLVLTVTAPGLNPILLQSLKTWTDQAQSGDHRALMDSNLRLIYSEAYYRKNKWMIPLVSLLTKPRSYDRFLIQARACQEHDARNRLSEISAPTLVLGGERDLALGCDASRELAAGIPGAVLKIYEQWGHGLYEEAPDFQQTILDFLRQPE